MKGEADDVVAQDHLNKVMEENKKQKAEKRKPIEI
jgi:hypothetical protein